MVPFAVLSIRTALLVGSASSLLHLVHSLATTTTATSSSFSFSWMVSRRSAFVAASSTTTCLLFSTTTSTSMSEMPVLQSSHPVESAVALLESVYGPVSAPDFPRPMPSHEAGLCADGHQRRYLWTDAFGVLAYVSLAEHFETTKGNDDNGHAYRQAAHSLVDVVHKCLGTPRSSNAKDSMQPSTSTPTGYVGLRIGKVESRQVTDSGMRYDGMYWHYLDKWLWALARVGRTKDAVQLAKAVFPYFMDTGPHGTGAGGGIRWKISVDTTPPPALQRSHANDDTLTSLIMFTMIEQQRAQLHGDNNDNNIPNLKGEIQQLQTALHGYRPRVTDDPLGWGLEALMDQFLQGHPRWASLVALQHEALHPSHLSLPFRLYGAILGARTAHVGGDKTQALVDRVIDLSLEHQARAMQQRLEEHSSINRVMLAMCLLCPGALERRPGDPLLELNSL